MAVVVRGRGVPRGDDVVGVITKEHVADSVAEQHEDLSALILLATYRIQPCHRCRPIVWSGDVFVGKSPLGSCR